jgi:hypothetical protein
MTSAFCPTTFLDDFLTVENVLPGKFNLRAISAWRAAESTAPPREYLSLVRFEDDIQIYEIYCEIVLLCTSTSISKK